MSRTISFSMTNGEYHLIAHDAQAKGLTPSTYAKTATFGHLNKYATKGVLSELSSAVSISENKRRGALQT